MIRLIIISIMILIIYLLWPKNERSNYQYMGSLYSPTMGGSRTEFNEECLNNENDHCMMTDGTPGKCMLNGICEVSLLLDPRPQAEDFPIPHCTRPYSAQACDRFCNCLQLQGSDSPSCTKECKSWFHPYTRDGSVVSGFQEYID